MEISISYPSVGPITRWSVVVSRGIVPSTILLDTIPQNAISSASAPLVITVGNRSLTLPDVVPVREWIRQPNRLTGFRNCLRLLDHRWRWMNGTISGLYNVRLPDGSVDPPTRRTPAELAALCLNAMGEYGYDVSRMPAGMYPPIRWDNENPAEALDRLCRYVGCEITGGHIGRVTIWPLGIGQELPAGDFINPPFPMLAQNRPTDLVLSGGNTVFQSRLKLVGIGRNGIEALNLVGRTPYGQSTLQSPFTYPDIADDAERTDAFQSAYKWFYTDSQADGSQTLPGCDTKIIRGTQYRLLPTLLDNWTNKDGILQPVVQTVLGKFWPFGDDADECDEQITYNGSFVVDNLRNLVKFAYPMWNLDSEGTRTAPELYLDTAYHVQSVAGGFENFRLAFPIGGSQGSRVIHRPEIFYSVKHAYDDENNISGTTTTLAAALAEASAYLGAFARAYTEGNQFDITWGNLENVTLDGRTAQVSYKGGKNEPFLMRASQMSEFDIYGPQAIEQRRNRYLDSIMERTT